MKRHLTIQLRISLFIYMGQLIIGYGLGWTAPIIVKLRDPELTPLPNLITEGQASLAASLLLVGCTVGPYSTGYLANTIGRKPCFILGGALTFISYVMVIFTYNLATVYALRILLGFGAAAIGLCNVVYLGEIASSSIRGILLTAIGISSTLGTVLIYSVGPFVSYRATGYIGAALSCIYIGGLMYVPETPLYHMLKGNNKEATCILKLLGRDDEVDSDIQKIEEQNDTKLTSWKEIFTIKSNRKALYINLVLGAFTPFSGQIALIFFATSIFDLAGTSVRSDIATIIIGVTQLISSCIAPIFVDKSGRRVLLMTSSFLCCLSQMVLGVYFFLDYYNYDVSNIGWIPLASLIVFFLSYDMGFGIIPGTLAGEMFRPNVRGPGTATTTTAACLLAFAVSSGFGIAVTSVGGHVIFWTFAVACACTFVFTLFFVPETKGKSLVEIEKMLSR